MSNLLSLTAVTSEFLGEDVSWRRAVMFPLSFHPVESHLCCHIIELMDINTHYEGHCKRKHADNDKTTGGTGCAGPTKAQAQWGGGPCAPFCRVSVSRDGAMLSTRTIRHVQSVHQSTSTALVSESATVHKGLFHYDL